MPENGKLKQSSTPEENEAFMNIFDLLYDGSLNDYDKWEEEQVFLDSLSEFNFLEDLDDDW